MYRLLERQLKYSCFDEVGVRLSLRGSWITTSRGNRGKRQMSLLRGLASHPSLSCEASVSVEFAALKSRFPYFGCVQNGGRANKKMIIVIK